MIRNGRTRSCRSGANSNNKPIRKQAVTTADISLDHRAQPLSELLSRLSRLDVLLRQEGFAHGPDRWLNLHASRPSRNN
jgi:hypothetical protein